MKTTLLKRGGLVAISAVIASLLIGSAIAVPSGKMGDGRGKQDYKNTTAPRQGNGRMAKHRDSIVSQLNLTQDQQEKVKAIFEDHRAQVKAIHDSNVTPEEKRTQVDALREQVRNQISAVLTPEQREKALQMWAQRDQMREQNRNRRMDCMNNLNLTADQKERIAAIRDAGQRQVQAVKADTNLSKEAEFDRIKEIRKGTHEQVMSVLSAEQREQMKQCKPGDGRGQGKAGFGQNKGMQRHRMGQ